jgi:hypothetical protein
VLTPSVRPSDAPGHLDTTPETDQQ